MKRGVISTKRVYEPRSEDDGLRVLVTRYWPRGIRKDDVDVWFRELGPERGLIREWKTRKISWEEFKGRYLNEYKVSTEKKTSLEELKRIMKKGRITLLCTCMDEEMCHRGILKGLLLGKRGIHAG